jgi:hypothetical protein
MARSTEPVQKSHRRISSRSVVAKSGGFRVAKGPPSMRRMAAIMPSAAVMRRRGDDVAIGEQGRFCEGEDPVGKPVPPRRLACSSRSSTRGGANFSNAGSDFDNRHRPQGQLRIIAHEPRHYRVARHQARRLPDNFGVEEDQNRGPVDLPVLADYHPRIEIAAVVICRMWVNRPPGIGRARAKSPAADWRPILRCRLPLRYRDRTMRRASPEATRPAPSSNKAISTSAARKHR